MDNASQRATRQGTHTVIDPVTGKRRNAFKAVEKASADVLTLDPSVVGEDTEVVINAFRADVTKRKEVLAGAEAVCSAFEGTNAVVQIHGKRWGRSKRSFTTLDERVVIGGRMTTMGGDNLVAGETFRAAFDIKEQGETSAALIDYDTYLEIDTATRTVTAMDISQSVREVDVLDGIYTRR